MKTVCSQCGKSYQVDQKYAGKKVRCKSCDNIIQIPRASTSNKDNSEVIRFSCVECGQKHKVKPKYSGQKVKCVSCAAPCLVPQTAAAVAAPIASQPKLVEFNCQLCDAVMRIPEEKRGSLIECESCGCYAEVPLLESNEEETDYINQPDQESIAASVFQTKPYNPSSSKRNKKAHWSDAIAKKIGDLPFCICCSLVFALIAVIGWTIIISAIGSSSFAGIVTVFFINFIGSFIIAGAAGSGFTFVRQSNGEIQGIIAILITFSGILLANCFYYKNVFVPRLAKSATGWIDNAITHTGYKNLSKDPKKVLTAAGVRMFMEQDEAPALICLAIESFDWEEKETETATDSQVDAETEATDSDAETTENNSLENDKYSQAEISEMLETLKEQTKDLTGAEKVELLKEYFPKFAIMYGEALQDSVSLFEMFKGSFSIWNIVKSIFALGLAYKIAAGC